MADTPALAPEHGYYQRLLARDHGEAADLIDRHITTEAPRSVYDVLLLPALNYAERDRLEERLSADEETAVIEATRELLADAAASIRAQQAAIASPPDDPQYAAPREPLRVLGYPANGVADELALAMLAGVLDDLPIVVEITNARMVASELVGLVRERGVSVVCLADLPPSPSSKTRYFVKRLRAALPELRILVGRWAPPALADDSTQALRDAGADHVASTLAQTREYIGGLEEIPRMPIPVRVTSYKLQVTSAKLEVKKVQSQTPSQLCCPAHPRASRPVILRIVFSPVTGDVVLRGSIAGHFTVLDGIALNRIAGPLSLLDALAFARQRGARRIFQQLVDQRGRNLDDPALFAFGEPSPTLN